MACSLNSLVDSHLKQLEKHGISATCLLNDKLDEVGILAGKYSILFANPESLIKNAKWSEMLKNEIYQNNLFGVVTDEAHVIPKWLEPLSACFVWLNKYNYKRESHATYKFYTAHT